MWKAMMLNGEAGEYSQNTPRRFYDLSLYFDGVPRQPLNEARVVVDRLGFTKAGSERGL